MNVENDKLGENPGGAVMFQEQIWLLVYSARLTFVSMTVPLTVITDGVEHGDIICVDVVVSNAKIVLVVLVVVVAAEVVVVVVVEGLVVVVVVVVIAAAVVVVV